VYAKVQGTRFKHGFTGKIVRFSPVESKSAFVAKTKADLIRIDFIIEMRN
jgi:hypothetical protein